MPVSTPPAFKPAVPPIPLGAPGTVLTSNGLTAATPPTFQPAAGGAGAYITYVAAAGASNNVNPAGFGAGVGRVDVDTSAGPASFTGWIAGTDGQQVLVGITGANPLDINALNAGSLAANQFRENADTTYLQNQTFLMVYYAGAVNKWVIVG